MPDYLFPHFETDPSEYQMLRRFWNEHIWASVESATRGWTSPWFTESPLEDGNPIFTAWAPARRIGLVCIQVAPETMGEEPICRVDWFGGEPTDPTAIGKLTIVCALTTRNRVDVTRLIDQWVTHGRVVKHSRIDPPKDELSSLVTIPPYEPAIEDAYYAEVA